jgi:hypothetical protein
MGIRTLPSLLSGKNESGTTDSVQIIFESKRCPRESSDSPGTARDERHLLIAQQLPARDPNTLLFCTVRRSLDTKCRAFIHERVNTQKIPKADLVFHRRGEIAPAGANEKLNCSTT